MTVFKIEVTAWDTEHPLDLIQPESIYLTSLSVHVFCSQNLDASPLSPLQLSPKVRDQSYHNSSLPLLYLIVSTTPTDPAK